MNNRVRLLVSMLALTACDRERPAPASPSASGPTSATAVTVSSSTQPLDASWGRALADLDDAELAALAEKEGALALAEALADPARAPAARKALPFARDVDEAFAVIAERLATKASVEEDLALMLTLTTRPQRFGERLDPEADARVVAVLGELAKSTEPGVRAKAETLRTRLHERGLPR